MLESQREKTLNRNKKIERLTIINIMKYLTGVNAEKRPTKRGTESIWNWRFGCQIIGESKNEKKMM